MRKWAWHHRQKYVLLALFHYWWSFLISDRGRSGVSSDKARQFQELLWCQITVVHHAARSLRCFLNFCLVSYFSSFLYLEGYVDLHVACTVKQKDCKKSEGQQLKEQTTAPSRDYIKSLYCWVDTRWSSRTQGQQNSCWVWILSFLLRISTQLILDILPLLLSKSL